MPFKSEAQRRFLWARHPDVAQEFADATPEGAKLPKKLHPEKTVKRAYEEGVMAALAELGLVKNASEEIRLQIPRRKFHGYDEAWRAAARNGEGEKKAEGTQEPLEPQAEPHIPAEKLTEILQQLCEPPTELATEATKDPLDRSTMWGGNSNLNARENVHGLPNNMGQDTSVGTVF